MRLQITSLDCGSHSLNLGLVLKTWAAQESEGDLVSVLAGLGRGEALVLGEAVPLPTRLRFERPNRTPNSDDIDFYKNWKDGLTDLDVKLAGEMDRLAG